MLTKNQIMTKSWNYEIFVYIVTMQKVILINTLLRWKKLSKKWLDTTKFMTL